MAALETRSFTQVWLSRLEPLRNASDRCPGCGSAVLWKTDALPWQKVTTAAELDDRYRQQQQRRACPGCGVEPYME